MGTESAAVAAGKRRMVEGPRDLPRGAKGSQPVRRHATWRQGEPTGEEACHVAPREVVEGGRDLLRGVHRAILVDGEDAALAWLVWAQPLVGRVHAPARHAPYQRRIM